MPVRPLCHGTWYSKSGSHWRSRSGSMMLVVTLGIFETSSFWIQPRSIIRAAIQSVRIIMSRLTGSQAPSWFLTLA